MTDTPAGVQAEMMAAHPGVNLNLRSAADGWVTVELIFVALRSRGAGLATAAMLSLTAAADLNGWHLDLTPSEALGSDRQRLEDWYCEFGFIVNRGRDHRPESSEWMIRAPHASQP